MEANCLVQRKGYELQTRHWPKKGRWWVIKGRELESSLDNYLCSGGNEVKLKSTWGV